MPIIKVTDCGKGVNKDASPEELEAGAWTDCQNMRFRNGYAQKFRGIAQVFDTTTIQPNYLTYYETSTTRYWVHAGTQKVFADDGLTRTEITPASPFTGGIDDLWSGGVFSGNLVLSNGVDQPHYWTGSTGADLATLPGWNATWRCDVIRPFKEYLIALNITKGANKYPRMVKWSAAGGSGSVPTSWDETDVTKDAGEQDLSETTDLIVDALPLGDNLIIYKQRSMFLMSFIGQPYIFRFQRLPGEDGLLARGCVVDTPVGHVLMTNGDIVVHTGSGTKSIADGIVRKHIFENMSFDNAKRSFLVTNPQKQEVLVCYPEEGYEYCNKAAVWNWKSNTWGFRDLLNATYGATGQVSSDIGIIRWADDTDSWESDLSSWNENEYSTNEARCFLSFTDKIGAFDIGSDDFGAAYTSSIERSGLSFDDAHIVKLLRTVYPRIDAQEGVSFSIEFGGSMAASKLPTYQTPTTFVCGTDFKADAFSNGRFIALKISNSSKSDWRMRSFDVDIVPSGSF